MTPKVTSSSSDGVTISASKLNVIRAVLCHADFNGIWTAVGEQLGLATPRTSYVHLLRSNTLVSTATDEPRSTLFRAAIASMGLDLKDGKVSLAGGAAEDEVPASPGAVKSSPAKRKAANKTGGTPKKQKGKGGAFKDAVDDDRVDQDDSDEKSAAEAGKVDAPTTEAKVVKVETTIEAA